MKKIQKGFTMAEILITLAIIGVVAAIALPAVTSLMPDKNKIMYLKAYDSLASTVKDLAYNTTYFSPVFSLDNYTTFDISKTTLANYSDVEFENDSNYDLDVTIKDSGNEANDKLCLALSKTFNILGEEACSETEFPDKPSFTTQNGMKWWITTPWSVIRYSENLSCPADMVAKMELEEGATCSSTEVLYYSLVYVDIDPAKNSTNCIVTDEACEKRVPDRFLFKVFAGGNVYPADSFGKEYLKNRMSTKKQKIEIENPKVEDTVQANDQSWMRTQIYNHEGAQYIVSYDD